MTRLEGEKIRLEVDLSRMETEFREMKDQLLLSRDEKRRLSKEILLKSNKLVTLENQVRLLIYYKQKRPKFLLTSCITTRQNETVTTLT